MSATRQENRFCGSAAAKGEGPGTEAECVTFRGTSNPSTGPNSLGYQFAYAACIRLSGRVSQAQRGDTFFYWFALMNGLKQSAEPLDPNRFQRYGGVGLMNIYTQRFRATCPNNGRSVDYVLTIQTSRTIMVEEIQSAVADLKGYHEDFACELFCRFGGKQSLKAHHHGTDVETVRP